MEAKDHEQMNLYKKPHFRKMKTMKSFGSKLWGKQRKPSHLRLRLHRIRDFISLWLSYHMTTVHDNKFKVWLLQLSTKKYCFTSQIHRLVHENPLRHLEGLIPMHIIRKIQRGHSFKSSYPEYEGILNLAADLAVDQLVQTLLFGEDRVSGSIHHVMLCTRNDTERRSIFEKLKVALKDKDNMVRLNEAFSRVFFIDLYQSDEVEYTIPQLIAQELQLTSVSGDYHNSLIARIEQEMLSKKYLVFLCAKKALDPRKVGFPKEKLAGVVVLVTSLEQAKDELRMEMDLEIRTEDHLLPWEIFCENTMLSPRYSSSVIRKIAVHIVEECGGHILAILLVAKSLSNSKDPQIWELALDKLRWLHSSYDISMFQGQSMVMVNVFLNFIWDGLSKTEKHCLICCLFIPKIKEGKFGSDLTNDWISSLLVDVKVAEGSLREFVNRRVLLQLEDSKGRSYIHMPEETYAILQSLKTQNSLFIKKSGLGLTEPPNCELWYSVVQIELEDNKLSELPPYPNCPELKVLMLQGNADLTKIPSRFFSNMPLLQIMDLSYTSVKELPDSFFELEQLRELYMKGCERFMILPPEIGKLKKLEKLDLDGTQIIHMPEEIQELTNLQSLTLCLYEYRGKKSKQYTCSTIIPSGVISKLEWLKHLSIDVNPDDERWNAEHARNILTEMLELKCLRTLRLYIPQLEVVKFKPVRAFDIDFRFVVGRHMQRIISSGMPLSDENKFKQSECSLKFIKGNGVIPKGIKKLVRHSKALFLDRHMTIKNLSEFEMMNLKQLRVCLLAECKEMETIVDGRHSNNDHNDVLSHLLYLSVSYMKNLRSIWEGPITPPRCFLGMLKSLALHNCPKLTTIFTLDFLSNLSLLKELIIKECPKVKTLIISGSDGSSILKTNIFLPKLRKILLLHLPDLENISNGFHMGPNLEIIGIYDCPKLQSLSETELSSQNLKVIKGETKWWDLLDWRSHWENAGPPSMFEDIFKPIVTETDLMTQLGAYEDDEDGLGETVGEPLQPSNETILKDQKQNDNRMRRVSQTWIVRKGPFEDEYCWRECTEKSMLGDIFPRHYYVCIHRNDGGCLAAKQVERSEVDPTLYETIYKGRHTCTQAYEFSSVDDFLFTQDYTHHNMETTFSDWNNLLDWPLPLPTQASYEDFNVTQLTQFEVDHGIHNAPDNITTGKTVGETFQPFGESIFEDQMQNAHGITRPTWTVEGPFEDEYSWKIDYQNNIPGAKFPRRYYICIDGGCEANKQVQQIKEEPAVYKTIYYGLHTCGNFLTQQHNNPFVSSYLDPLKNEDIPTPSFNNFLLPPEFDSDDFLDIWDFQF